jgi:hypothetical protein
MIIYKGAGFIPGVPARDLTDEEAKEYAIADSPLYEKADKKKPAKEVKNGRD